MVISSRNFGFIPHHFELKNALKKLRQRIGFLESGAGFTLIELIVAISVIAILSTLGIAAFVDYSRRQELENATKDIVETLNLAKSRAQSQVKPVADKCGPPLNYVLKGHVVRFYIGKHSYSISAVCERPDVDHYNSLANTETKTTSSNITISTVPAISNPGRDVLFEVTTGYTKFNTTLPSSNLLIKVSGYGSSTKKIYIDDAGKILVF